MPDNFANTPASVTVVFPRADNGSINDSTRMNSGIRVEQHFVLVVAGSGHAGTQIIHSTAVANFEGESDPVNLTELQELASQIASAFYAWRLASLEIRYESVVDWAMDGMHDVDFIHGYPGISTSVHRSEWEPEQGELQHAGTYGSSAQPPIGGTQGVQVTTGVRFDDGSFDGTLLLRDNGTQTDAVDSPIWILDWAGATSLAAGAQYNGTFRGIEPHGPYYLSLISANQGNPLTDTSAWLPTTSDPASPLPYVPDIVTSTAIANGALTIVSGSAPTDFASLLNVNVIDSDASITAGTITIVGTDEYGNPYSEDVVLTSGGGTQTYSTVGVQHGRFGDGFRPDRGRGRGRRWDRHCAVSRGGAQDERRRHLRGNESSGDDDSAAFGGLDGIERLDGEGRIQLRSGVWGGGLCSGSQEDVCDSVGRCGDHHDAG